MTIVQTREQLVKEIAYAAVVRQRAKNVLETAAVECKPSWTMRQHQRSVDQADRRISMLAETLAAHDELSAAKTT